MEPVSQEPYQVINLIDWTGGIRDNRQNPLAFPQEALMSGENVDLVDRGLQTRRGVAHMSWGSLPESGAVRVLKQVRFPTNESTYLLAQVNDGNQNALYCCTDQLPVSNGSGVFTQIYDLGEGAEHCSIALLNDRAVITEGAANPPLVFAGCMNESGSDWAVPKAVLVTYDSGENYHDVSAALCDKDPDTLGFVGSLGPQSGWIDVCVDMSGVSGFQFDVLAGNTNGGSMSVEGYSGAWGSGSGWTDNTSNLSTTGTVVHSGGVFHSDYHVVNGVPGYWFRFTFESGTSSDTAVKRVLFQAPTQQLQVIGDGQPDTPLGLLYWDHSENSAKDWTVEVSDNTWPTVARLNDDPLNTDDSGHHGWEAAAFSSQYNPGGDRLYTGYLTRFNAVEIRPHNDYHNKQASSQVLAEYWNGYSWLDLTLVDETQEPAGTTMAKKGRISWQIPADWKQCRPIGPQYPHGYWVRFRVDADLSLRTWISEARVWPVMNDLKKHKLAITVRDRIILLNRPDAPDQADISRPLEEYGFAGTDSSSMRIGGQDSIVAAVEAFNQGFVAKTEDWFLFNGYNPQTFSFERAEAANQVPINNRVVVRAPHTEADQKNLMGLYYLNRFGAWYFAGLKVYHLSGDITWFDAAGDMPRIDLDDLHKACGVYWPERNWIIWSVPMITTGSPQTFNNCLIIYDLKLRTWLPPFGISLSSLATAYHHNDSAPGKLGQIGLYGGDYNGRVIRLFGPDATDDFGSSIAGWVETGWLHFGTPEYKKLIRVLTLYGKTAGELISVKVYTDGDESSFTALEFKDLSGLGDRLFAQEQKPDNIHGRFFKFRIEFSDVTDVYGLQIGASVIREWGAM